MTSSEQEWEDSLLDHGREPNADECSDPDADRPCSCDESLQLKAAVLELQNQLIAMAKEKAAAERDRDHYKGIWQIECERTVQAVEKSSRQHALPVRHWRLSVAAEREPCPGCGDPECVQFGDECWRNNGCPANPPVADWFRDSPLKRMLAKHGLHLVTDADLRVLEGCSKLDLGEVRYLAKHHEHDWAHAELARRGEKP